MQNDTMRGDSSKTQKKFDKLVQWGKDNYLEIILKGSNSDNVKYNKIVKRKMAKYKEELVRKQTKHLYLYIKIKCS